MYTLWQTRTINLENMASVPTAFKAAPKFSVNGKQKKTKLKLTQFKFLVWGTHQTKYSESATRIKDASWDTIISSAQSFAKSSHKPPSSAELIIIDDNEPIHNFNPCANLVEELDCK